MQYRTDLAIEVLSRTPATLRAMLSGLSDDWLMNNYGPETFSPFDVVGHLIHGEKTDWIPRMRRILAQGDSVRFDPFDRYAMYQQSQGKTIQQLLDEFELLRKQNLLELSGAGLTEAQLDQRGLHPTLGTVSLRQLLATWVAHDLNHVHQIAKCMAIQYREACGPWAEFLGVYR